MHCRLRYFFLAFLLLLVISCHVEIPEHVLQPEKMEEVLYDYHLTQSMGTTLGSADYKEKLMYTHLFDKHNITKEQFDSSLVWYNRYPKHMWKIYMNLEERMQQEIDFMGGAKIMLDEGIAIEAAYLESNIAELWTSHRVKMLKATALNNSLLFSFDTPKDSSFMVGDSLVFSFNAMFVSEDELSVKQEAFASIFLEYADRSTHSNSIVIDDAGYYSVAVPRNDRSRLKSMSGYVLYIDSDTTYRSGVVLSDISVRRLHSAHSKKDRGQR